MNMDKLEEQIKKYEETVDQVFKSLQFRGDALRRILSAAQALERGEANPREVAQEIQKMCDNGLLGIVRWDWTWEPNKK